MVDLVLNHNHLQQQQRNEEPSLQEHQQEGEEIISRDLFAFADSLAVQGQLTSAFHHYSKAFRLCQTHPPEVLRSLADALSLFHFNRSLLAHMSEEKNNLFRCYLCKSVLYKPITLSCGHTFCHKCLQNDETRACRLCGVNDCSFDRKSCRPTMLLHNLVDKVFPKHSLAESLRQEGKKCMQKREFTKAIELFNQALIEAPSSHLVLSNRSLAYSRLEQYKLALKDAERVIVMQPTWPKGYYRKGCILHEMHNDEAAVTALLDCLAINPYWSRPKEMLLMTLHHLLSEDAKREENLCKQPSLPYSLTKRAQLACIAPNTDLSTCSGETSQRPMTACPSFKFSKHSKNRKPNLLEKEEGWTEAEKLGAAAATCMHQDDFYEKSMSDSDEFDDEEECCQQSRQKKSNSLPSIFNSPTLIESIPVHAVSDSSLLPPSLPPPPYDMKNNPRKAEEQYFQSKPVQENSDFLFPSQSRSGQSQELLLCDASCCQPLTPLLKLEDFQCSLCLNLLYQPLVTPCGHAFCRECLVRSLDHSPQCPLCKQSLTAYLAARKWAISECLESIIKTFFPKELERRKKIHEEEMAKLAHLEDNCEIPVFICTFACPTIRCPLHIFEPRYRLMIRRCLECGSNQFGMSTPSHSGSYADVGCMLKIKNVQMLDDGRSLLDTVGDRRFKVLKRGMKDGYNIAKVSFLKDDPIENSERAELIEFQQEVYTMSQKWLECLLPESLRNITEHYGPLPLPQESELDEPNGPSWVWWMITILPIDKKLQVTAMSFTKLQQRLQFIKSAILTIQNKLSS